MFIYSLKDIFTSSFILCSFSQIFVDKYIIFNIVILIILLNLISTCVMILYSKTTNKNR